MKNQQSKKLQEMTALAVSKKNLEAIYFTRKEHLQTKVKSERFQPTHNYSREAVSGQ